MISNISQNGVRLLWQQWTLALIGSLYDKLQVEVSFGILDEATDETAQAAIDIAQSDPRYSESTSLFFYNIGSK